MSIHYRYKSPDGLQSIVLCGTYKHTKTKQCPTFSSGAPVAERCELCIGEGIQWCECGKVANSLLSAYQKAPRIACAVCAESSPLGTMVRPLPGARDVSLTEYADLPTEAVEDSSVEG